MTNGEGTPKNSSLPPLASFPSAPKFDFDKKT
jgi:hypothetical protein